jgi:lysophospholipase L1-like esterase
MYFDRYRSWRLCRVLLVTVSLFLTGVAVGQSQAINSYLRSWWPGPDGLRVDATAVKVAIGDTWLDGPADVVLAGDSLIAMGRWDEMLPGVSVNNRGIGGDTVSGLLLRSDAIVAKSPRQIVVMIGINDLMAGSRISDIARQYDALVVRLAKDHRVTLLGVLYCGRPRCNRTMNERVKALNIAIADVAKRRQVQFIDFNPRFVSEGKLRSDLTYDGVHLNGDGYRLMRDLLAPYLCGRGKCEKPQ